MGISKNSVRFLEMLYSFMALRDDIDIRNAKLELAPQLEEIKAYAYA